MNLHFIVVISRIARLLLMRGNVQGGLVEDLVAGSAKLLKKMGLVTERVLSCN
jgi:hypothetical protein